MEKLNELVDLAKKATPGRNPDRLESCGGGIKYQSLGDDGSLVLQCDHKNDEYGFIGPKSLEDEAFFLACNPDTILTIAEAFRALERTSDTNMAAAQAMRDDMYHWKKRAEAAEAKLAEQGAEVDKANALIDDLRVERDLLQRLAGERGNKLESAEAKLAELARRPPVGNFYEDGPGNWWQIGPHDKVPHVTPLFTRPAPAVDLAELVPAMPSLNNGIVGYNEGWNSCRAAILRNIEQKK